MTVLSSPKNAILQTIKRAAAAGRPTEDGLIVLEGPILLAEALRSEWSVVRVYTTPECRPRLPELPPGITITEITQRALESIASTATAQGVIALAEPIAWRWENLLTAKPLVLILDGIQDPGNAGTLVRSAEAFGATGVATCNGSVRFANGKFLRASAGSVFRMPYMEGVDPKILFSKLRVFALDANGTVALNRADLKQPCGLVVGSEGSGLSPEFKTNAVSVTIPVQNVESLNAAVAGSIALFEAARQRGVAL
jgi:TrmH family RNA methyltransferase